MFGRCAAALFKPTARRLVRHNSTLHALLGLEPSVSYTQARQAYQEKAKLCHPDIVQSHKTDEFVALQTAWERYLERTKQGSKCGGNCQSGCKSGSENPVEDARAQKHMEMVLLVFRGINAEGHKDPHRLRHCVTSAVRARGQARFGNSFPPTSIRRVHFRSASTGTGSTVDELEMHLGCMNPRHREAVVELVTSKDRGVRLEDEPPCAAFIRTFRDELISTAPRLSAAANPNSLLELALHCALPYTSEAIHPPVLAPPPAARIRQS